jgi:hypothetical protein
VALSRQNALKVCPGWCSSSKVRTSPAIKSGSWIRDGHLVLRRIGMARQRGQEELVHERRVIRARSQQPADAVLRAITLAGSVRPPTEESRFSSSA